MTHLRFGFVIVIALMVALIGVAVVECVWPEVTVHL